MQEKVYLGIRNNDTGEYFVSACSLPAQIGRQHDVKNQVLLDPKYRTVSRIHGMIERTSRGFVYTDSSTSGSRIAGLIVRDSRIALPPSFEIEIENYTMTRVEMAPLVVLATNAGLAELQTLEILPGRGLGVAEVREVKRRHPQRVSLVADRGGTHELIDLNRWTEWDIPTVGRFEFGEPNPIWVMPGDTASAKRNKSALALARTPLASLDVIEVGAMRFELLHPHESRIVCGYDRCHLLNPPPIEANCRFCGRHLANAGGFSRIL